VSGTDMVTVLTTKGPLATKRITLPPGATRPVIDDYAKAAHFGMWEAPISGIDDLAALLSTLERRATSFFVRGKPAAGVDRRNAKRRLHARKAKDGTVEPATIEGAARHWIPLDVDSIACPDLLDPVHEPDRTVEHVVGLLPEEFHGATCWWAFTSGQGVKDGIRLRLFFWADRALTDWELKEWLGERVPIAGTPRSTWARRFPVDLSIFAPAQPIYVARPIFVGMPDPVPTRSGIWRGDRDAITPPVIEKPKRHVTANGCHSPASLARAMSTIAAISAITKAATVSMRRSNPRSPRGSRAKALWPILRGYGRISNTRSDQRRAIQRNVTTATSSSGLPISIT
jgi:hypothetical protein